MKKTYVAPTAVAETFVANEYCSTCGKKGGKYIFTCDAPAGTVYYYKGDTKQRLGGYHPCTKVHETDGPSGYYNGFVDRNNNGTEDEGEGALIWIERGFFGSVSDWHASASLSQNMIEVERS